MKTTLIEIKKYCDYNGEFICLDLDEPGLIVLRFLEIENLTPLDRLKMVGKHYQVTGEYSADKNFFHANKIKEIHNG